MTTDIKKPLKIYPSSSGFIQNGQVVTDYNSACLRYILVASKAPYKNDLDPIFAQVGAQHEDWYAGILGESLAEREKVLKDWVTPQVEYSGRCDFVTKDGVVHETKATLSKNGLYGVINKGEWKVNHLAQLVSYLIQLEKTEGKIIVGYYEKENEQATTFIQRGFRVFDVRIGSAGAVTVDGIDTGHTVSSQLAHRYAAASTLQSGAIGERPRIDSPYKSPCAYCPLQATCDSYDAQEIDADTFRHRGVSAIGAAPPMKAKVNLLPKRRRKT